MLHLLGTPPGDDQRVHAAILDAGGRAVLHGPTTLAWFGLRGYDLSDIHVVRRRETTRALPRLAVLHRLRDLTSDDVVLLRGVPTVRPIRAIWSEASRFSGPRRHHVGLTRIGRLLDDAHRDRLVTWSELHDAVKRLGRSGRAGTTIMRTLADERLPGTSPTESRNEDRLEQLLADAGRAPLIRQRVVGDHKPIGRVDHRDQVLPLVVETNSLAFHSTPSDRAADEVRYQRLLTAGFCVVVAWEDDLWSAPNAVVEAVDEGRRRARGGTPAVVHSPSCPWPRDFERILVGRRRGPSRG